MRDAADSAMLRDLQAQLGCCREASEHFCLIFFDPLFRDLFGPLPTGGPRYMRTTLMPFLRVDEQRNSCAAGNFHHIASANHLHPNFELLKASIRNAGAIIPSSEDPRVAWLAMLAAIITKKRLLLPIMHCIRNPRTRKGRKFRNVIAFLNQQALIRTCNVMKFPLLAINDYTGSQLRALAPRSRVFILRPKFKMTVGSPKAMRSNRDVLRLICIGRQSEHKGSLELPGILDALFARGIECRLDIVGDEPKAIRQVSSALASQLGLETAIYRHGRLGEVEKNFLLSSAHVLVNPSHEEGYSYVVAEAIALGVPAVVWDIPEMLAVWQAEPSVCFARHGDIDSFANAILIAHGVYDS